MGTTTCGTAWPEKSGGGKRSMAKAVFTLANKSRSRTGSRRGSRKRKMGMIAVAFFTTDFTD